MNPKQFLQMGGALLLVLGILGLVGVLGPTADQSIFGETWWFDNPENWAHLVVGVVTLIAAFALSARIQKQLVMVVGIVGVLVGLYGLFVSDELLGANLENPADIIFYVVVGLWALLASMKKGAPKAETSPPAEPAMP
jgi:hypothetical protein